MKTFVTFKHDETWKQETHKLQFNISISGREELDEKKTWNFILRFLWLSERESYERGWMETQQFSYISESSS